MELLLSVFMSLALIADSELKIGDKICVMHDTIGVRDGQVLDHDVEAGSCCDIKAIDGDWLEIIIGEKPVRVRKDFVLPVDRAIEYWNAAIIRQPKEPDFYRSRARCFYVLEKYDAALNDYQHCVALAPADAFAHYRIASICRMQMRYRQAVEAATVSIWLAPKSYQFLCERSLAYLRLSDFDRAVADVNETLKLDPYYAHGYVTRGFISLQKRQYDHAISDFTRAIEIEPMGEDGYVYRQRGWCYAVTRQYEKSINDFDKVIESGAGSASDFYYRGTSKWALAKGDQALADLMECIRLEPKSYNAYMLRAEVLLYQKKSELAIFELDQAEKVTSEEILHVIYSARAVALCETSRWKQAIGYFSRAIEISPKSAVIYSMRGLTYDRDANSVEASKDLEQAVRLNPNSAYCVGNLAKFLSSTADEKFRDSSRAVVLATTACELSKWEDGRMIMLLSEAYALSGDTELAKKYRNMSSERYAKWSGEFLGISSMMKSDPIKFRR